MFVILRKFFENFRKEVKLFYVIFVERPKLPLAYLICKLLKTAEQFVPNMSFLDQSKPTARTNGGVASSMERS